MQQYAFILKMGRIIFAKISKILVNENSHVHDSLKTGQEFTKTYCVCLLHCIILEAIYLTKILMI